MKAYDEQTKGFVDKLIKKLYFDFNKIAFNSLNRTLYLFDNFAADLHKLDCAYIIWERVNR